MRQAWIFSSVVIAAATVVSAAHAAPGAATHPFALSRPIDNQYIVVFKREVAEPAALAAQLAQQQGGRLLHSYRHTIKGFAARLPAAAVAALRNNPQVDYVEPDATVSLNEALATPPWQQPNPTWGLDRIDQASLPINGSYHHQYRGVGVHAFVIDTGILASHVDFGGRVSAGYSAIADGNGTTDCNGHGTHVAGTVGGSQFGVAKAVTLVPVRVLDCTGSGSYSGIIAGVDWVAGQGALRPAVANMSLGGGLSAAVNASVAGAVAKGVTMVVAAGNSSADACQTSPASEPSAITVGATSSNDSRASYSNYGACLDLFAPGSAISSDWHSSTTATNTLSGTSMAAPHVTGVAALALAANGSATPAAVTEFLLSHATPNKVIGAGSGSPNRLVYSMAAGAPATPVVKTVAVSAITGKGVKSGTKWRASATVTVRQYDGYNFVGAIAGATVAGMFSPGGAATCVTGSTGSCTLNSGTISRSYTTSLFGVGNVTGSSLVYDASKNAVSSISVSRP
ncbi:MAG: hypothetical protein A2486_15120 [Burkholderiales bacterium RIFOXYC12_FULL_65_23]|uniref:S8 family peptidase n=1 Tax=Malikia spinosa TaxID=86180 RepID=UPI0008CE137C|nr:S8 family peptidase [Malikia spinosa]OGB72488.1 MAG: hypothetical protein A2486_15120 [Burkholderiales bacterium RIFOXYC12_FULL_65_23]